MATYSLYFRSTCIRYRTLCTLSPLLNTSQCRRTGTGFRAVLSSQTDPYSLLTAAWGFLIPFRLPRVGQILVFRAPRESADSRVAWFAGGLGRAGDEFILAGSPGPAGASYLLTIFFFLKSQIPT